MLYCLQDKSGVMGEWRIKDMRIARAEISDLPLVVEMKMNMFREVGSASLLQEHAEEMILQTYRSSYQED